MIRWTRSEDGHVASKCGRWKIQPVYWGRVRVASYHLVDAQDPESPRTYPTQRAAKTART